MPRKEKVPVTVIIMTYKRKKFLKPALDSVLRNSVAPQQIILAKCFSDPILEKELHLIGVEIITFSDDTKYGDMLNECMKLVSSDIVLLLEDDDLFFNEKISVIFDMFSSNPSLVAIKDPSLRVHTYENQNLAEYIDHQSEKSLRNIEFEDILLPITKFSVLSRLFSKSFNANPSTMSFRKEFLLNNYEIIGCNDPPDVLMGLALIQSGRGVLRILNSPLTLYRVHESNDSIIANTSDKEIQRLVLTGKKYICGLSKSIDAVNSSIGRVYIDSYIISIKIRNALLSADKFSYPSLNDVIKLYIDDFKLKKHKYNVVRLPIGVLVDFICRFLLSLYPQATKNIYIYLLTFYRRFYEN